MVYSGLLVRCFSSLLSAAHVAFVSLCHSVVVVGRLYHSGVRSTAWEQEMDMLVCRYD